MRGEGSVQRSPSSHRGGTCRWFFPTMLFLSLIVKDLGHTEKIYAAWKLLFPVEVKTRASKYYLKLTVIKAINLKKVNIIFFTIHHYFKNTYNKCLERLIRRRRQCIFNFAWNYRKIKLWVSILLISHNLLAVRNYFYDQFLNKVQVIHFIM